MSAPEQVLAQIRSRRWVDVVDADGQPQRIHHKHARSISSGTYQGRHVVLVQTFLSRYLLPVDFPTAAEAEAFLQQVHEAFEFTPAPTPQERLL